jgi:hypothetical protein
MMNDRLSNRSALHWLRGLLLILFAAVAVPNAAPQQDPTFRLMTLERRVDQLQQRLDFIERNQQNQVLNQGNTRNYNNELLLEIQRQQLSLAQQSVELQQRMLEMQKTLDRLSEQNKKTEPGNASAKPAESAKPKPTPRKP